MPDQSTSTAHGVTSFGFSDVRDYIEKITNAIWNGPDRDPELVRRYYGPATPIQTDNGDVIGAEQVTANTHARLRAFPDFHGIIEDTIWTGDESVGYRTSMRWTWTGTDRGGTIFGGPTGRPVRSSAIANCVVRGDQIVDEWLGMNPLALARQLGRSDSEAVAAWEASDPAPVSGRRPGLDVEPDGPGLLVAELLDGAFNGRDLSVVDRLYTETATQRRGADRSSPSRAAIRDWYAGWLELCPALTWSLDDSYWLPAEVGGGPARVATQWTLRGETATGPFRAAAISHHHVDAGRVVAEWTEYDQLALLRQCRRTI